MLVSASNGYVEAEYTGNGNFSTLESTKAEKIIEEAIKNNMFHLREDGVQIVRNSADEYMWELELEIKRLNKIIEDSVLL